MDKEIEMSEKFFRCNCGCGGVVIEIWPEDWNIYISFLSRVSGKSFRSRVKLSLEMLRYGQHFDTDIVLTKEMSKELGKTLLEMSAKLEK